MRSLPQTVLAVQAFVTIVLLPGCMTKATTETTKAPFDATTEVSKGTTRATGEFTEPTRDFTARTSPRSWFDNGIVKHEYQARAFAAYNFDNLTEDMAKGHGEYLTSFATLLEIPVGNQAGFFHVAQERCSSVCFTGTGLPKRVEAIVQEFTRDQP